MALKIRLRQQGRTNRLTYRLVVADSRSPRDGKYLEKLGDYDPHLGKNVDASIAEDKVKHWIGQGAVLSEKAKALVERKAPEVVKMMRELRESRKKRCARRRKNRRAK